MLIGYYTHLFEGIARKERQRREARKAERKPTGAGIPSSVRKTVPPRFPQGFVRIYFLFFQ
jgi:hypothetical protein